MELDPIRSAFPFADSEVYQKPDGSKAFKSSDSQWVAVTNQKWVSDEGGFTFRGEALVESAEPAAERPESGRRVGKARRAQPVAAAAAPAVPQPGPPKSRDARPKAMA